MFDTLKARHAEARSRWRLAYAVRHLDNHLLRDIGLADLVPERGRPVLLGLPGCRA